MSIAWPGAQELIKKGPLELEGVMTLVHDTVKSVFKDSWVTIGVDLAALPSPTPELPGDLPKYLDSPAMLKSFTRLRASYAAQLFADLCTCGSVLAHINTEKLAEFLSSPSASVSDTLFELDFQLDEHNWTKGWTLCLSGFLSRMSVPPGQLPPSGPALQSALESTLRKLGLVSEPSAMGVDVQAAATAKDDDADAEPPADAAFKASAVHCLDDLYTCSLAPQNLATAGDGCSRCPCKPSPKSF